MKYKITTRTDCYTEYIVEADNEKKAEETFWEGNYLSEKDVDFRNEEIEEIEETKEEVRKKQKKEIYIQLTESDLQELQEGKQFEWEFDGVITHIYPERDLPY